MSPAWAARQRWACSFPGWWYNVEVQRIVEEHGVLTVLRAMQFLMMRLEAHQLAPPLVEELSYLRTQLDEAQTEYETARTARLAATAEIAYRDDVVDEAVLNLANEALRLFGGDREHPAFRNLFPVAPEQAIASTAGKRQHDFVGALIERLQGEEYAALSAHRDSLTRRQSELTGAIERREACFEPEARASARRAEGLDNACRCYNRCHARLQLLRVDKALIESLYPALSHGPLSERSAASERVALDES